MSLACRLRRIFWGAALCALTAPCSAQESHAVRDFPDSGKAVEQGISLHKNDRVLIQAPQSPASKYRLGDTLIIRSSSALLLDEKSQARYLDLIKKEKAVAAASETLMQTGSEAIAKNDTLQSHWREAHRIDSIAYRELRSKYDDLDKLLTQSRQNTERVIIKSYVTAILLGAVAGGVAGGSLSDDKILGAAVGAGVGVVAGGLLNFIVLKIPIGFGSK